MITAAGLALSKLTMPHDVPSWKTKYKKINVPATIEKIHAELTRLALLALPSNQLTRQEIESLRQDKKEAVRKK